MRLWKGQQKLQLGIWKAKGRYIFGATAVSFYALFSKQFYSGNKSIIGISTNRDVVVEIFKNISKVN